MTVTRILATALVGALTLACAETSTLTEPQQDDPLPPGVPADANVVPFESIDGVDTPVSLVTDRRRLVIDNAGDWIRFWTELQGAIVPAPPAPTIDFTQRVVVAATMGQQPSAGYAIAVEGAFEADGTLFLHVVEASPGVGCAQLPVLTAPAVAVMIDGSPLQVSFVEETRSTTCS